MTVITKSRNEGLQADLSIRSKRGLCWPRASQTSDGPIAGAGVSPVSRFMLQVRNPPHTTALSLCRRAYNNTRCRVEARF
jgi:hypothetical protein